MLTPRRICFSFSLMVLTLVPAGSKARLGKIGASAQVRADRRVLLGVIPHCPVLRRQ